MSSSKQFEEWNQMITKHRPLPAAVVDLEAFDANVQFFKSLLGNSGHRIRVATKSIRVPELIKRVLASGAPYQGVMTYSCAETLWLAQDHGVNDFLIAYPSLNRFDLKQYIDTHQQGFDVKLMVDQWGHIEAIKETLRHFAIELTKPLRLCIEVDMSLRPAGGAVHAGVRRSPVRTVSDALSLAKKIAQEPNFEFIGLMGYEAQVAGLNDDNSSLPWFKNRLHSVVRSVSVNHVRHLREELKAGFDQAGMAMELFNAGGSGSINYNLQEPWLSEVTVGSAFLCPTLFDGYSNIQFKPSAFFALNTVRQSDTNFLTCQGGGYIASGSPGWDRLPKPVYPPGLQLEANEGCGEVQTPVQLDLHHPQHQNLKPGDPIWFRHAKAGELAERFNEYILMSGGQIHSQVKTYRGLGQCFF